MSQAIELAKVRFANGEITEQEYKNIIETLSQGIQDDVGTVAPQDMSSNMESSGFPDSPSDMQSSYDGVHYVGFWARLGAALIDTILLLLITALLISLFYGMSVFNGQQQINPVLNLLVGWIMPVVLTLVFWQLKQATPGKMLLSAKIVDAKTGRAASAGRLVARYVAYIVSTIPLGLGFLWIAFDKRKQGWHDKISGTMVVSTRDS